MHEQTIAMLVLHRQVVSTLEVNVIAEVSTWIGAQLDGKLFRESTQKRVEV